MVLSRPTRVFSCEVSPKRLGPRVVMRKGVNLPGVVGKFAGRIRLDMIFWLVNVNFVIEWGFR